MAQDRLKSQTNASGEPTWQPIRKVWYAFAASIVLFVIGIAILIVNSTLLKENPIPIDVGAYFFLPAGGLIATVVAYFTKSEASDN